MPDEKDVVVLPLELLTEVLEPGPEVVERGSDLVVLEALPLVVSVLRDVDEPEFA